MKTKLRNFVKDDIKQIAQIEKQSFIKPWNENMLLQEYDNPLFNCTVCIDENIIAGYINYHIIADEYDIDNIAVSKCYQRKGIATMLINNLIDNAQKNKIRGITLEVGENNSAAISLYNKFGFKAEGRRKNYYKTEDAIIMWKYF